MAEIRVAVEGEGAVAATEALLQIEGLAGNWAPSSEEPTKETVIATIATIVGIVGGTMAIAEQIRKWYQEYKKKQFDKKIDKVLIVSRNGERLLLEDATIEQIQRILES